MALTFSGTNSVNHGSASAIDNLSTWTMVQWVYPTTLGGTHKAFIAKGTVAAEIMHVTMSDANTDELWVSRAKSGGNDEYTTSNANITTNKWWYIAVSYNSAGSAGERFNCYVGSLTSLATETTYDFQGDASGTLTSDAANSLFVGNDSGGTKPWIGRIAMFSFYNSVLTLGQIRSLQFRPRVLNSNCQIFSVYGYNGTSTQPDLTGKGNSGTVTGATVGSHVPIGLWFGADTPFMSKLAAPPGGATIPIFHHHYQLARSA